jgi:exonuclease III
LKNQNIKIPGYQTFFKNRENSGGCGLITAIDENLASIQVSSSDKDILVVQVSFGEYDIRVINAYGPQEANCQNKKQIVYEFWQEVEKQIILAFEEKCLVIVQMDANAKLRTRLFAKDPHETSENGLLLSEMAQRQNLHILNTDELCTGVMTRHRTTSAGEEKSIIDFTLVCEGLKLHFEYMVIDEDRTHVLTKYCKMKGSKKEIQSDHNVQYVRFNLKYQEVKCKTK